MNTSLIRSRRTAAVVSDGQATLSTAPPPADAGVVERVVPSRRPVFVRVLVTVLATLAMVLGVGVSNASAATWGGAGYYGGVTNYQANAQYVYGWQGNIYTSQPGLAVNGPYVTRSAGSAGQQVVKYAVQVSQWNGTGWVPRNTAWWSSFTLNAGQAGATLSNNYYQLGRGTYAVTFSLVWYDAASGRALGSKTFSYTSASDYSCSIACTRGAGWVSI